MIEHVSDVPRGDAEALAVEKAAVVAYLSAATTEDDNVETNADNVVVHVTDHPDDPDMVRIVGTINAKPVAPYLRPGYDPLAGVDPDLYAAEVMHALQDEEASHGQA